jgi:SAM-dependent methyltransferase/uncharacterized protein YbaR (Trm112 family)
MRPRLNDLFVCPIDRQPLELHAWESDTTSLSAQQREIADLLRIDPASVECDVQTGVLLNPRLKILYPILNGVPRMLTFPVAVHQHFLQNHGDRIRRECEGYRCPDGEATPGEQDVLRTFSSEWVNYDWNEDAYWDRPAAEIYKVMDFMLDLDGHPVSGKKVLEVGIGIGGIANHIAEAHRCELVGIDLSYSVDPAQRCFGRRNPFFHVVQASAFKPPFRDETFDLVYSQGVLHHTYCTHKAVESISQLPRKAGRLYVWVYSWHDEQRTWIRRRLMQLERVLRPVLWRLPERLQTIALTPIVPLYLFYHSRLRRESGMPYGWREAIHAARDRFTPRFIHRHSEDEVMGWFRELGYTDLRAGSQRTMPDYVPISISACTAIDGIRS